MIRLQPEWVGELVALCARDDWSDLNDRLGYPSVSPMFRSILPEVAESDDVSGYSSAEVRACRVGIEWLCNHFPRQYASLQWEFQPGKRHMLTRDDQHEELVLHAARLLEKFIDKYCGS